MSLAVVQKVLLMFVGRWKRRLIIVEFGAAEPLSLAI